MELAKQLRRASSHFAVAAAQSCLMDAYSQSVQGLGTNLDPLGLSAAEFPDPTQLEFSLADLTWIENNTSLFDDPAWNIEVLENSSHMPDIADTRSTRGQSVESAANPIGHEPIVTNRQSRAATEEVDVKEDPAEKVDKEDAVQRNTEDQEDGNARKEREVLAAVGEGGDMFGRGMCEKNEG